MARILLVEDDDLLVRLYQRKFALDGYDVRVARDGEEALVAVGKEPPDLILLDIMMPNMDGIDVLKRLKSHAETRPIPIVMLTNLSAEADVEKALELGAAAYLVKSDVLPNVVVAKVKEVLAASTRGRDLPKAVPTGKKS